MYANFTATSKSQLLLELKLPNSVQYLSVARTAIASLAAIKSFSFEDIEDIKLAVSEACANAILHTKHLQQAQILLRCYIKEDRLITEVVNVGTYFSPESIELPASLDEFEESGLGLVIMRALMDEVEFLPNPEDGTIVRLTKRLPPRR